MLTIKRLTLKCNFIGSYIASFLWQYLLTCYFYHALFGSEHYSPYHEKLLHVNIINTWKHYLYIFSTLITCTQRFETYVGEKYMPIIINVFITNDNM